jgi:hypothetical protein
VVFDDLTNAARTKAEMTDAEMIAAEMTTAGFTMPRRRDHGELR